MIQPFHSLGLRHRLVATFALLALLILASFAVSTYAVARGYLLEQRERAVQHQMYADEEPQGRPRPYRVVRSPRSSPISN